MRRSPTQTKVSFKSLLNCSSEMSLSRNATDREFQRDDCHAIIKGNLLTLLDQ